jgi:hypothetical protein
MIVARSPPHLDPPRRHTTGRVRGHRSSVGSAGRGDESFDRGRRERSVRPGTALASGYGNQLWPPVAVPQTRQRLTSSSWPPRCARRLRSSAHRPRGPTGTNWDGPTAWRRRRDSWPSWSNRPPPPSHPAHRWGGDRKHAAVGRRSDRHRLRRPRRKRRSVNHRESLIERSP